MFQSNLPNKLPSEQNSTSGTGTGSHNGFKGWVFGTKGIKRSVPNGVSTDSEFGPPPKLNTYVHSWRQPIGICRRNFSFTSSEKSDSVNDDIELELATEVAQSLNLSDDNRAYTSPFRSKRKSTSQNLSRNESSDNMDGEEVENSKRRRIGTDMDWEDYQFQSNPNLVRKNNISITDKSKDLFLSDEVQSFMESSNAPDSKLTPEKIIIERILKQNAMAIVPWVPPMNILEQGKIINKSNPKPSRSTSFNYSNSNDDDSDSDQSDSESIIVETPNGTPVSICMDVDDADYDDL